MVLILTPEQRYRRCRNRLNRGSRRVSVPNRARQSSFSLRRTCRRSYGMGRSFIVINSIVLLDSSKRIYVLDTHLEHDIHIYDFAHIAQWQDRKERVSSTWSICKKVEFKVCGIYFVRLFQSLKVLYEVYYQKYGFKVFLYRKAVT